MYKTHQQLLYKYCTQLVKRGKAPKFSVIAEEVGMSPDEFSCKICINPRTPIFHNERISIEHLLKEREPELYLLYLREYHLNEEIEIK